MLLPVAAHAQYGDWYPNWTSVDDSSEPSQFLGGNAGWSLHGAPTGHSENTYTELTNMAFSNGYEYLLDAYSPHKSFPSSPPNRGTDYLFLGGFGLENSAFDIAATAANYYDNGAYSYCWDYGDQNRHSKPVIGSVSASASAPLKLRLKWTPYYDGGEYPQPAAPPAPDHVDLLVTTYLAADTRIDNSRFVSQPVSGSVGRSASATASLPRFGEMVTFTLTDGNLSVNPHSASLSGRHLLRVGVSGGIAELTLDAQGQAQATAPVPSGGPGLTVSPSDVQAQAHVSAWGQVDNRAVTLRRDNAHNEKIDPDGTVHGDSTYSYLTDLDSAGEGEPAVGLNPIFRTIGESQPLLVQGSWSRQLVKAVGQGSWSRQLVKAVGQGSWSRQLVKAVGQGSWSRQLVKAASNSVGGR